MRKREREITLLYGVSLIRDDVLDHPQPKHSAKDRLIAIMHYAFAFASVLTFIASSIILILTFIPITG